MRRQKIIQTRYLTEVLTSEGLKQTVLDTTRKLRPYRSEFDAIAFRGVSGALVAPNVAQRLNKDLIVVRKHKEVKSHSKLKVEGVRDSRYIILDDFVDDGNTITAIHREIEAADINCNLVGVVLYNDFEIGLTAKEFQEKTGVWFLHAGYNPRVFPTQEFESL